LSRPSEVEAGDRLPQSEGLDHKEYAFTRIMAGELRVHDDRAEFLAGIDPLLAGMMASR
jgi:hypothetical protein